MFESIEIQKHLAIVNFLRRSDFKFFSDFATVKDELCKLSVKQTLTVLNFLNFCPHRLVLTRIYFKDFFRFNFE